MNSGQFLESYTYSCFQLLDSGYMAPEYAMEGIYSVKSDVFSFGVVLLEILSGKKNSGFHLTRFAPSLLAYVRFYISCL